MPRLNGLRVWKRSLKRRSPLHLSVCFSQKHQELSEKRAQRQARLEAERLAEEERRKAEVEREVRELRRNLVSLSLCPHPFSAFRFWEG